MKKYLKFMVALSALLAMLGFVSCSSDDDDDDTPTSNTQSTTQTGDSTNGGSSADSGSATGGSETASTVTTGSWNLSQAAVEALTITGYGDTKTGSGKTATHKYAAITKISSGYMAYLTEAYNYASGSLNLTFADYNGTGVGTSQGDGDAVSDWTSLSSEYSGPYFKTNSKSDYGLCIKRDALKISGVKGNVTLTVSWALNSDKNDANNRYLEVTVDGKEERTGNPAKTKEFQTYTRKIAGGDDGVDVYIGASNEIFINSIKIEAQ